MEENADLRRRVDEMDREMARIRSEGQATSQPATSLPAGVPAAVAIAPEAVEADAVAMPPEKSGTSGWIIAIILGLFTLGGIAFIVARNRR